ncbi:MAG TPA: N-acetyl-gamma-glutamyl-phosphate reductase [Clostridia bacterium]|nr:N-acetyl-gamma-glutamyl-phosphate reductase [Clostridia bacterium]
MIKVFIDGQEGTTGLKLAERLKNRKDVVISVIPEQFRKEKEARREYLNSCDVAFLCLPDLAAVEAVAIVNTDTKIIDASTAHRTNSLWAYGFPELSDAFRNKIALSHRIAVPGCHASGFLAIVFPLIAMGILPKDYPIVCHSLTGYSGGGKKMISEYTADANNVLLQSPRQYALEQNHKHLKEMKAIATLDNPPIFNPIVANYAQGMEVTVPLYASLLRNVNTNNDVFDALKTYYDGQKMLSVERTQEAFMPSNLMSGTNLMKIFVGGNDERINLIAVFDNLGKGASGAAVQCMNIVSGIDETTGLI